MLFPFILFVFVFLVYFFGVSHSVYGGDSGDIILASWFGGVAHPPGYPLNTMLGWIFGHLPYQGSIAYKVDLMAAVLQAGVVTVLFLCFKQIIKNVFVALSASLVLAFNPLFWLYAHIIEVFQLNLLLVAVSVYFLFIWRELAIKKQLKLLYLNLSSLFLGLAIFHHQTSILLVPAYVYLVSKTDKRVFAPKSLIRIVPFFFIGFLPNLFLPFASMGSSPVSWDRIDSFSSFIKLITRADYGTFVAIGDLAGADLRTRLFPILNYLLFVKADYGPGIIVILIGAIYVLFKDRVVFWFILISFLLTGPFFFFYSSFPSINNFYSGLWERFILITYFFLSFYLAYGFYFLLNQLINLFSRIGKDKLINFYRIAFTLLLFFLPLLFLRQNYIKTDLSEFRLGDDLGRDILASAEPNAIIFLMGDTVGFNTEYVYFTDEKYRDRYVIRAGALSRLSYRNQVYKNYPNLNYPDDFLSGKKDTAFFQKLVDKNIDKLPIYAAEKVRGIENDYSVTSSGLLRKIIKKDDYEQYKHRELVTYSKGIFNNLIFFKDDRINAYANFLEDHIKEIYYLSLIDYADELANNQNLEESLEFYNKAIFILPDNYSGYEKKSGALLELKRCNDALSNLNNAYEIEQKNLIIISKLSKLYKDCYNDAEKVKYYSDIADSLRKSRKPLF